MQQPVSNHAIEARGLGKSYGPVAALTQVTVDVPRGQICALLGQNGAGKTTFINCALGLVRPSAGSVRVNGNAAGSMAARRMLGVMLQDTDLPDQLTAREHLALFANYFDQPRNINVLIKQLEMGGFANRRYKRLSGGQKRRVQFAVSLVGRPDVLFLDEPTTGLDQDARRAVWDSIRQLARAGKTVILTTHYLEEADALADRIVVLASGRIIADGSAAAVRSQVGGALIACETQASADEVRRLPAVRSVEARGRMITLLSDDAAQTLSALLQLDPRLKDLTVKKPSLEEAFAALTRAGAGDEVQ